MSNLSAIYRPLEQKIRQRAARIGIIGLGYVGLPLAVQFVSQGFKVTGFDTDAQKVSLLNRGENYIRDLSNDELKDMVQAKKLSASQNFSLLKKMDAILICVPTPLTRTKEPDITPITYAAKEVSKNIRRGQLIILRSTTYPGTTEEVVCPLLESTGLLCGKDFYLAFSPERVDPGNKEFKIENTPVVVGGVNPESTRVAKLLLEEIIIKVVPLSSSRAAEMTKLLENIFRSVNIALVNELTMLCERMDLDVWEIVDAAASKPFGYMSFTPGPGVGGHCIPVDPYFLSWKAREFDFHTDFIYRAAEVNENMPYYVVDKTLAAINHNGTSTRNASVLVLGVTFKKDIDDVRTSPALKIIQLLEKEDLKVSYHDPYVSKIEVGSKVYKNSPLTEEKVREVDCVLIITDHSCFDYSWIVKNSKMVFDTRNATKDIQNGREKIIKI